MSTILFNQEPSENTVSKGELSEYSDLKVGMKIVFESDDEQLMSGQILELYTENDNETDLVIVTGCLVKGADEKEYEFFDEENDKIWKQNINSSKQALEENITEDEKKLERKPAPNLFQGRTEAEKGNAKFPDWDIVPSSQFINPRMKPQ